MLTVFDKILSKEIRADIVFENDYALSFFDIHPQAPVHVLVIPKRKMVSFIDIRSQEDSEFLAGYFRSISQTASTLGLEKNGYRVVFNTGSQGGQEVPYIHAHILGGRNLGWPPG